MKSIDKLREMDKEKLISLIKEHLCPQDCDLKGFESWRERGCGVIDDDCEEHCENPCRCRNFSEGSCGSCWETEN